MSKYFLTASIIVLVMASCQKQPEIKPQQKMKLESMQETVQETPVCGLEEAMQNMLPEYRQSLSRMEATAAAAAELLLYLDFDGATVFPGFPNPAGNRSPIISGTRICPPPSLTAAQIEEVIELVKDDFSPFHIVITMDYTEFLNYSAANKQICIITTVPAVAGFSSGIGGISPFGGLGVRLPFNPCFVFANLYGGDLAEIASVISHESAHTMGLGHQSYFTPTCGYIFEYHPGFGAGPLGFGPIMGIGDKRVTNWYAQSCFHPVFGPPQDDFNLLNSQVAVRADDFPNNPSGSLITATEIDGILEAAGDADFFRINFKKPGPVTISSENADIKASLYNNGGHLLAEYNDPGDTHVTIPSANGLRYLKIEAVSNANMSAQFMTGKYRISY